MTSFVDAAALQVGDLLPSFEATFSSTTLFAYGAATWDWSRVHYDADYARSLGFPDAFVDGQHYGALFAKALMHFLGPTAFITRMKFGFREMTFRDETVIGDGKVIHLERQGKAWLVTFEQRLRKKDERQGLVSECTSVVRVGGND